MIRPLLLLEMMTLLTDGDEDDYDTDDYEDDKCVDEG